jgi:hypothetical protein
MLEAVFSVIRAAAVAMQRRGKHVSATMNQHSTIEELLETMLSTRSIPTVYQSLKFSSIPCGGGIEYLHHSPASPRRRRKAKSRIWGSKQWSRVPWDSDPRMTALARASSNVNNRSVLSSERAHHVNKPATDSNKNLLVSPRWVLYSTTDWPTDRRSWYKTQTQFISVVGYVPNGKDVSGKY